MATTIFGACMFVGRPIATRSNGPASTMFESSRPSLSKTVRRELCASSSNRNFKGRQGSPTGRTLLMSPVMVAAAAVSGSVADAREVFGIQS